MPNPACQRTSTQREIVRTKLVFIASQVLYAVTRLGAALLREPVQGMLTSCCSQQKHSRPVVLLPTIHLLDCLRLSAFSLLIQQLVFCLVHLHIF
jgi:hypothetical protein